MIPKFALLSLLAFVKTEATNTDYTGSAQSIQDAKKQLRDMILSMKDEVPDITDPRRHYAVIVNHFIEVGYNLASNCSAVYEEVYIKLLPSSIAKSLTDVQYVINSVEQNLKILDDQLEMIETFVGTVCPKMRYPTCNQIIDQIVKRDPQRYDHSAYVLLEGGDMAEQLLDAQLIPVANSYKEVAYLINHMDDLKDLIAAAADRIKIDQKLCDYVRLK